LHLAQSAYCGNRDEVVEGAIDSDPTAAAVPSMTAVRTMWTGTASNLLGALAEVVGDRPARFRARGTGTPPTRSIPRQKTPGRNRPHRPHRPVPKSNSVNGFSAELLRTTRGAWEQCQHGMECNRIDSGPLSGRRPPAASADDPPSVVREIGTDDGRAAPIAIDP
jgi:hypothetical protein